MVMNSASKLLRRTPGDYSLHSPLGRDSDTTMRRFGLGSLGGTRSSPW